MSTSKQQTIPGRTRSAQPRLSIRGPAFAGLVVLAVFFGGGIGSAAFMPLDKGIAFSGAVIVESKVQQVQHKVGGTVGRVLVQEGQEVKAGDVLVSLDASQIGEQIDALKKQADAAKRQLVLIKQEAQAFTELMEKKLAPKSKVLALERQVAEVEKETAGLVAKIAVAEQELRLMEIRSPVAGRVLTLAVRGAGGVIQAGGTVAEVVPQEDRLVLEGRLTPMQIEHAHPGMVAKVWLRTLSFRNSQPFRARLSWVSPDTVEDKRSGAAYFVARIELEASRAEIAQRIALHPGMRAELLLLTGERTLLDQLLDPLVRNMNRAFRA